MMDIDFGNDAHGYILIVRVHRLLITRNLIICECAFIFQFDSFIYAIVSDCFCVV